MEKKIFVSWVSNGITQVWCVLVTEDADKAFGNTAQDEMYARPRRTYPAVSAATVALTETGNPILTERWEWDRPVPGQYSHWNQHPLDRASGRSVRDGKLGFPVRDSDGERHFVSLPIKEEIVIRGGDDWETCRWNSARAELIELLGVKDRPGIERRKAFGAQEFRWLCEEAGLSRAQAGRVFKAAGPRQVRGAAAWHHALLDRVGGNANAVWAVLNSLDGERFGYYDAVAILSALGFPEPEYRSKFSTLKQYISGVLALLDYS